ncbi:MAG TPA: TlpA disulfide reductase family protein [Candidatus Sulfotelmatobacter sp.]|nr:TlpA disulfide reductase family protein [Candidatus Sulfotelmatobacter sp.]
MTGKLTVFGVTLLVLVLAVFLGKHMRSGTQAPGPKPHPLAPDFTLTRLDGQRLTLSSYRGRIVLLDFWATWCVPCREEIPRFVELQNKYGGRGLQIIGVSMDDSADPVRPFAEQFHMNYPVVMGNAKIGEAYGGVLGLPIAFLLDRDGRIVKKHIGATGAEVFEAEVTSLLAAP